MKETRHLAKYRAETSTGKQKTKLLIPPDRNRCQAMIPGGCRPDAEHFMIIGPASFDRCTKRPSVVVKENSPNTDGRKGSMSLCSEHYQDFLKAYGENYATATKLHP